MDVDFDKMGGLIPAVVQDAETEKVLMLGFMNEEALRMTEETGLVTFYSRSRKKLWTKGETSGNKLHVLEIKEDCDKDTLLVRVKPDGPVCHLGTGTCWGEENTVNPLLFLGELQDVICKRKREMPEGSYTTYLFREGTGRIAQKVGEEAVETIIEAMQGKSERLIYEASDLVYHMLVLLASKGLRIEDVARELAERHKPGWEKH